MGTNECRLDIEKRAREAISEVAERDARRIVAIWNGRRAKGRELWFHLRIGGAIAAGHPWLMFVCPACQQIGEIDLRKLDRHPNATIESLVLSLRCRRCRPNPPFVKLLAALQVVELPVTDAGRRRGAPCDMDIRRASACGRSSARPLTAHVPAPIGPIPIARTHCRLEFCNLPVLS
jgi:hypothetical protein